jgi:hypothetical protein
VRSLAAAVAALQQLLVVLRQQCGWRPHRVHLLGFSQATSRLPACLPACLPAGAPHSVAASACRAWQLDQKVGPQSLNQCWCGKESLAGTLLWRFQPPTNISALQGGTVALQLARQQQAAGKLLGSCVAVSASLLPEQLAAQRQQQPAAGPATSSRDGGTTPVLITHGSADKGEPPAD